MFGTRICRYPRRPQACWCAVSIERCTKCCNSIDTDFDFECYVGPGGREWEICLCENCREADDAAAELFAAMQQGALS